MVQAGMNVIYGIMSSIIYDIGKVCLGKFSDEKDADSFDKINEMLLEQLDEKYLMLIQSSEFNAFIENPCFKDVMENYVIYKITGKCEGVLVKVKKGGYGISEKQVVDFLTDNLFTGYFQKSIYVPSKTMVRQFFREIFNLASNYIASHLKNQNKAEVYFINSKIDMIQENLLLKLSETTELVKKTMQCEIVPVESKYKEIVEEYHDILRTNNSKAHIYLLDTFDFSQFYVPPFLKKISDQEDFQHYMMIKRDRMYGQRNKKMRGDEYFSDWKYIFDNNNIVYITGGAGYGKSLFLKKIINDFGKLNILNSKDYLVIYGELKAFFKEDGQVVSITQFLQESMVKETLMDKEKFPAEMIEYYIKMGRCLVLFDALDEVQNDRRNDLHKRIVAYFQNQNPNNKICITSRNRGFIPERQVEVFDIAPLNRIQIEAYVDNIIKLGKFDENDKEVFLEQSSILVDKGFLNSFLVLSLLINIYKAERELPENKMELYQKCFEYIASRREKEKMQGKYDWSLITCMMKDNTFMELADMCFPNNTDIGKDEIVEMLCQVYRGKYISEAETEQAAEQFLKFCSDRTELFVPAAGEDRFKFFHRSFFEYFYSQYIFHRLRKVDEVYNALTQFDVDSEVFELTFAMMKQKDERRYQELVEFILERVNEDIQSRNNKYTALNILILGMQVVDDKMYKVKFVEILSEKNMYIAKNIEKVHNQWIISDIVTQDNAFIKKINDAYKKFAVIDIMEVFLINYPRVLEVLKQINAKEVNENDEIRFVQGRMYLGYRYEFYTKIYLKSTNINHILESMSADELGRICTECKTSKKKKEKLQRGYSDFMVLEKEERDKIRKILLGNEKYKAYL